jgi:hypothetical protein
MTPALVRHGDAKVYERMTNLNYNTIDFVRPT